MVLLLLVAPVVPYEKMAYFGRFTALVMLLWSMILLSFPVAIPVEKKRSPPASGNAKEREDPLRLQYLTVLLQASLMNLIVDVPLVVELFVFETVRSFEDPVAFTLPSMVTLSAPFRSINGAARFPLTDKPVTVG